MASDIGLGVAPVKCFCVPVYLLLRCSCGNDISWVVVSGGGYGLCEN